MSNTTLADYETAGQPTNIDDLEWTTDTEIVDTFDEIDCFKDSIQINDRQEQFLVGRTPQGERDTYTLHHWPEESGEVGFVGTIVYRRALIRDGPNEHVVAFVPAGDNPTDETVIEQVESLVIHPHGREERLDGLLPELRTDLTDSDWTEDGRADTGYGEWLQATNTLIDYIWDHEDALPQFPVKAIGYNEIMHAIARYPLNANDFMSQAVRAIERNHDDGLHGADAEALRSILFAYADDHLE